MTSGWQEVEYSVIISSGKTIARYAQNFHQNKLITFNICKTVYMWDR